MKLLPLCLALFKITTAAGLHFSVTGMGRGGGGVDGVATNLNRARTDGGETQYVESAAFHVA